LAFGLVLHHALAGEPALGLPDVGAVIDRMPPQGRDSVRLPRSTSRPIPDALRSIVNRATERQPRQRYRNARTLVGAIEGWSRTDANSGGEPIRLLLDRMRVSGFLPAMPGSAARAARIALMEGECINALADSVRQDLCLSLELLRGANCPELQGALGDGGGAILTLRRAIAMMGLDGLRRAAMALRVWPGSLNQEQAGQLAQLIARVQQAGRAAQCLRPAGYDAELVALLAMLQNLGRLALQYHFPDEAAQIRRLMQPAPPLAAGEPEQPGMSEESACLAVLGVDVDALGTAVGRHWGFDDQALWMVRRLPQSVSVHFTDADQDLLRLTASCANELVDAWSLPEHQRSAFVQRVAQRYGRALGLSIRDLVAAAQGAACVLAASAQAAAE
jgi:non-specific serine/threonine protein kinase